MALSAEIVHKLLRTCSWEGIIYIDDLGTLVRSYYECMYWKLFVRDTLARAGWVVNKTKDQAPDKDNILLGAQSDTVDFKFKILLRRLRRS